MGSLGLFFQKYIKKDSFKKSEIILGKNLPKILRKLDVVFLKSTNKLTNHKKSVELKRLKKLFNIEHFEFIKFAIIQMKQTKLQI